MQNKLVLSSLAHTWIFDLDGTLCVHNGYLHGGDRILPGVKELFLQIPTDDLIIIMTSRKKDEQNNIEVFLHENGLRFNGILCDAPLGERIIVNDDKPSGLKTCLAVRKKRDEALDIKVEIEQSL